MLQNAALVRNLQEYAFQQMYISEWLRLPACMAATQLIHLQVFHHRAVRGLLGGDPLHLAHAQEAAYEVLRHEDADMCRICMHACMLTERLRVYAYVHVHLLLSMMHLFMHIHFYRCNLHVRVHAHVHAHVHVQVHVQVHLHVHVHVHVDVDVDVDVNVDVDVHLHLRVDVDVHLQKTPTQSWVCC